MKFRITKFAAAAVIIVAIFVGFGVIGTVTTPAYGIEQTLAAYDGLRYLHIKYFKTGQDIPLESWVEFDDQNQIERMRAELPSWLVPDEGERILVWQDDLMHGWLKDKNTLMIRSQQGKVTFDVLLLELGLTTECDPREAVKRVDQLEVEGKVKIEMDEGDSADSEIIITATYSPESDSSGRRIVLFVDKATKLVAAAELYHKIDNNDSVVGRIEYSDHNVPIDAEMFRLDDVGDDVAVVDMTRDDVGLAQGEFSDREIAVEVVARALEAIKSQDYEKVSSLWPAMPIERLQEWARLVELVGFTLDEEACELKVSRGPIKWFTVPCTLTSRQNGSTIRTHILFVVNSAHRMIESGGRGNDRTLGYFDSVHARFIETINSKVAAFDINNATHDDVIETFGEPEKYVRGAKVLQKNNLPDIYEMRYPGNYFSIFMWRVYVRELLFKGQDRGYLFADKLRVGSSLEDVIKVLGPPTETVIGGQLKFQEAVLYKDINGEKGFCFYTRRDRGVRVEFRDYKVWVLYVTRTEPMLGE